MIDVSSVVPPDDYRLRLKFADGTECDVDLAELIRFDGIFAPLRDRARFLEVGIHPELGTLVWPNGADLDPDVLYARVTSRPINLVESRGFR